MSDVPSETPTDESQPEPFDWTKPWWKPWALFTNKKDPKDRDRHVIPADDKYAHVPLPDCPCRPRHAVSPGQLQYVHQSYDNREVDEWWFYNISNPGKKPEAELIS